MKTVILCGGYGTRIRDVSDQLPKPMIPIGRHPILYHIMRYYAHYNFREFVLCLGYRSEVIKDYFKNLAFRASDCTIRIGSQQTIEYHEHPYNLDWTITMAETGLDTQTGGRVRRIARYVQDDQEFFLTYGDGLSTVDLRDLLAFHKSHGKLVTITGVRPQSRFGEIAARPDGIVAEFKEKPQASEGRISGGFFVCNRKIFDYLSDDDGLILERDPMQRLARDGQLVMFPHDGFWQPMDTHREYQMLTKLVESGSAPWMMWSGSAAENHSPLGAAHGA